MILERHHKAVQQYQTELNTLLNNLNGIEASSGPADKKLKTIRAKNHLKEKQKRRAHQPLDPNNLPFRTPDGKVRKPKESKEEYQALFKPEPVRLASTLLTAGMLTPAAAFVAPVAADLTPTEDVQITPEIQALAQSLNHNPVQIHNWVHNNIYFIPTYGSIQGSQMCLETKQCNAFDTASLLIALLRASNIPARYVYGTVQIPVEKVMNWVGGVTTAEAAQQLLGQGGIPNTGLISGGKVVAIKLEHVWVEAYVDFYPSGGAINKQGDSWVPMDGSFKQYEFMSGMDIKNSIPFDGERLASQIQANAISNQSEGWIQHIDIAAIRTALDSYQSQLQAYIDNTKPNATVGDVLGHKAIVLHNRSVLASSLPYRLVVVGNRGAALSASHRHYVQFAIYASELDRALGNQSLTFSQSLPSLADKRIQLAFEGETTADQSVIDGAFATGNSALTAYLIRVKPVLKIDSSPVAAGAGVTMGDKQWFSVTLTTPQYASTKDYQVTAGDFNVLSLNAAGITPSLFQKRTTLHDLSKGDYPDFGAEMFHQIALAWWGEKYVFNSLIGNIKGVVSYQLPSHALMGSPLTIRYFFGIARSGYYASRVIDGKEDTVSAQHIAGDQEQRRRFMLSIGQVASFLESNIFEQAFLMPPDQAISTISAWKISNDRNIPIYTITQSNAASALPQIATDADAKAEMANAIAAGMRVTVPKQDITVGNFSGTGYFLEDPITGGGAYVVTGGRNGGSGPAPQSVYPLPQIPATGAHMFIIGAAQRALPAARVLPLVAGSTAVEGILIGGAAITFPELVALIAILVLMYTLIKLITDAMDRSYPRYDQPLVLRHYSRSDLISFSMLNHGIYGSNEGTHGPGIYFTDMHSFLVPPPPDSGQMEWVGCPPTYAQSESIKYYLEMSPRWFDNTDRVITAWVELEFDRKVPGMAGPFVNTAGGKEWVLYRPRLPAPPTGTPLPFMLYGEAGSVLEYCY